MPAPYIEAVTLACGRVVEAGEVGGSVMYCDLDSMSGVDILNSGLEAGLELLDQGDLDATDEADLAGLRFRAAATPTRNEPCSSEKRMMRTFGSDVVIGVVRRALVVLGEASMTPKSWSGCQMRRLNVRLPQEADADDEVVAGSRDRPRRSARSPSLDGVDSIPVTPNSASAWSSPAAAASLNEGRHGRSRRTSGRPTGSRRPEQSFPRAWSRPARCPVGCFRPVGGARRAVGARRWCLRVSVPAGVGLRRFVGGRRVVVVATCCGGEAERGDETDSKQMLAPYHCSPLLGIAVSLSRQGGSPFRGGGP